MNAAVLAYVSPAHVKVETCRADELEERRGLRSELDEMWSYVGKKANQRWLWHAIGAPCKRHGGMSKDLGVYRYPLSRWGSASWATS